MGPFQMPQFCNLDKILCIFFLLYEAGHAKTQIKILQLGDSYSAGNGARDSEGHRNYYGPAHCYRSPTNWGGQYVEALQADYNVTYSNHACSFSYLTHLMNPKLVNRKLEICPPQSSWLSDEYYVQTKPLQCNHYVVPQINFVDNTTDLVIMTMGGNDALFVPIIQHCFLALAEDAATQCQITLNQSYTKMPTLQEDLKYNLLQIWDRMGRQGKVVVFQYPYLTEDKQRILKDDDFSIDSPRAVRTLMRTGNLAISAACDEANSDSGVAFCTTYNKTMDVFAGHEPDPFLLRLNPKGWFREFLNTDLTAERYHPNTKGHEHWGAAVAMEGIFGLDL